MTAVRIILVVAALLILAVSFVAQEVWREYRAGCDVRDAADLARVKAAFAGLRALPEPSWSQRLNVRDRLISVEVPGVRPVAAPLTEAEWLDLLAEPYDYVRRGI